MNRTYNGPHAVARILGYLFQRIPAFQDSVMPTGGRSERITRKRDSFPHSFPSLDGAGASTNKPSTSELHEEQTRK